MSLNYNDEHLAWQQRIQKEISTLSNSLYSLPSFHSGFHSPSNSPLSKKYNVLYGSSASPKYKITKKQRDNKADSEAEENSSKPAIHLPSISNNSHRSSSMNSRYSMPLSTPKSIRSWNSKEMELKTPEQLRHMLKQERLVKYIQRRIRAEEKLKDKEIDLHR